MPFNATPTALTPAEYEIAVKAILDASGPELKNYESAHLRKLSGVDGDYIIDVAATFEALGAKFTVLVECKHERRKVERQDVQILKSKLDSTGAQKAMLFSVAGFQSGAIDYATVHGIALVVLAEGSSSWLTKSQIPSMPPPNLPSFVGWWCRGNERSLLSPEHNEYTRQALGLPSAA